LVKGDNKEIDVFGRKVKLGEGGQYQVKWNSKEMSIETASVEATGSPKAWAAGEDLYSWFSGNDGSGAGRKEPRRVSFDGGGEDRLPEPRGLPLREDMRGGSSKDDSYTFTPDEGGRNGAESEVVDLTSLPKSGAEGEYVIQPGDTVDLSFYRVQRVTVDLKGDIRVASSVGSAESVIKAAGKTPKEVAHVVMDSGLNFRSVIDPALKVSVARFSDRSIVVLGAVRKPGKIPLDEGEIIGVPGVLKRAGGVSGDESGAVVYVKRGDRITKANLGDSDREALNQFKIMPGDIITVNKK
jgi:protein involved in polysaccharide export with SLBB domain